MWFEVGLTVLVHIGQVVERCSIFFRRKKRLTNVESQSSNHSPVGVAHLKEAHLRRARCRVPNRSSCTHDLKSRYMSGVLPSSPQDTDPPLVQTFHCILTGFFFLFLFLLVEKFTNSVFLLSAFLNPFFIYHPESFLRVHLWYVWTSPSFFFTLVWQMSQGLPCDTNKYEKTGFVCPRCPTMTQEGWRLEETQEGTPL